MEDKNNHNQLILKLSRNLIVNDPFEIHDVVAEILADLGNVFDADRAFVFLSDNDLHTFSAQWEWFRPGMIPLRQSLQGLHDRDYMIWGKFPSAKPCFQISNTSHIPESYPFDSKLFRNMGCQIFIQKSMVLRNETIGFLVLMKCNGSAPWTDSDMVQLDIAGELFKSILLKAKMVEVSSVDNITQSVPVKHNEFFRFFDKVFGNLHYGISIFDTVIEKFIFVNPRFSELFNSDTRKALQSRDIFSIFKSNGYNIADLFSRASKSVVKDFTIQHSSKYLNGSISPVKDTTWVVVSVYDITPITNYERAEKSFNHQLKIIGEAAIELISEEKRRDDIFQFVGETAHCLFENSVILVNRYYENEGHIKTVSVKGIGFSLDAIARLLGKHPLHKTYMLDTKGSAYANMISMQVKEISGGLSEISFGAVPPPVAHKIEKVLNVERFFVCGLYAESKLYGTLVIMLRPGDDINLYIIETFARMVSNALHAFDIDQKLEKTTRVLSDAAKLAKIGYWEYDFSINSFIISRKLLQKLEPLATPAAGNDEILIPLTDFLHQYTSKEDAGRISQIMERAAKSKRTGNYEIDLEFRLLRSGQPAMFVYTRGVVQKDGKIMGVAQDITEIKKVEKSLWESELKFQNLVEQSGDAIVVVKDDGVITEWNPRAEEITGIEATDAIGKYAWEIESETLFNPAINKKHPQQSEEKLRSRFFKFFSEGAIQKPLSTELSIKARSGEVKYLTVTSFIFSANQSRFLCRISKDITEEKLRQIKEKEQEIQTKTAKAKELFLDNMSHEMRTPLSGIIGMTDILLHTRMSNQQNEMLKVVKESSDSLLELISSIHELSRLESKGVEIQPRPFRVAVLLEKTITIFKASALQKSIELVLTDNTPPEALITGDEFRLRQVLGNLVGNAIKFTPPGGKVEAIAYSRKVNATTLQLLFEVKDTGIGVQQDKIPMLFEKFTQVDSSYTREYEGVGIGLAISKQLVELMGGQIGVSSEHRSGSTFWVKINLPFRVQ